MTNPRGGLYVTEHTPGESRYAFWEKMRTLELEGRERVSYDAVGLLRGAGCEILTNADEMDWQRQPLAAR